jgi:hypothetical protein
MSSPRRRSGTSQDRFDARRNHRLLERRWKLISGHRDHQISGSPLSNQPVERGKRADDPIEVPAEKVQVTRSS